MKNKGYNRKIIPGFHISSFFPKLLNITNLIKLFR